MVYLSRSNSLRPQQPISTPENVSPAARAAAASVGSAANRQLQEKAASRTSSLVSSPSLHSNNMRASSLTAQSRPAIVGVPGPGYSLASRRSISNFANFKYINPTTDKPSSSTTTVTTNSRGARTQSLTTTTIQKMGKFEVVKTTTTSIPVKHKNNSPSPAVGTGSINSRRGVTSSPIVEERAIGRKLRTSAINPGLGINSSSPLNSPTYSDTVKSFTSESSTSFSPPPSNNYIPPSDVTETETEVETETETESEIEFPRYPESSSHKNFLRVGLVPEIREESDADIQSDNDSYAAYGAAHASHDVSFDDSYTSNINETHKTLDQLIEEEKSDVQPDILTGPEIHIIDDDGQSVESEVSPAPQRHEPPARATSPIKPALKLPNDEKKKRHRVSFSAITDDIEPVNYPKSPSSDMAASAAATTSAALNRHSATSSQKPNNNSNIPSLAASAAASMTRRAATHFDSGSDSESSAYIDGTDESYYTRGRHNNNNNNFLQRKGSMQSSLRTVQPNSNVGFGAGSVRKSVSTSAMRGGIPVTSKYVQPDSNSRNNSTIANSGPGRSGAGMNGHAFNDGDGSVRNAQRELEREEQLLKEQEERLARQRERLEEEQEQLMREQRRLSSLRSSTQPLATSTPVTAAAPKHHYYSLAYDDEDVSSDQHTQDNVSPIRRQSVRSSNPSSNTKKVVSANQGQSKKDTPVNSSTQASNSTASRTSGRASSTRPASALVLSKPAPTNPPSNPGLHRSLSNSSFDRERENPRSARNRHSTGFGIMTLRDTAQVNAPEPDIVLPRTLHRQPQPSSSKGSSGMGFKSRFADSDSDDDIILKPIRSKQKAPVHSSAHAPAITSATSNAPRSAPAPANVPSFVPAPPSTPSGKSSRFFASKQELKDRQTRDREVDNIPVHEVEPIKKKKFGKLRKVFGLN